MKENSTLFKYELAITAILKNEAPYIKEWIDYHILAGVEHFYLYNNDSEDNLQEVLQPYIEKNIVDYTELPGKCAQLLSYNDAIKKHKYDCRYMAFIDADEYLYPQSDKSITEIIDEIFSDKSYAAGLAVHWRIFGSSGLEKADLNKNVTERFVYRTSDDFGMDTGQAGNAHIKTIANPRCIKYYFTSHISVYFDGKCTINEKGNHVPSCFDASPAFDKIVINHYSTKSKEEFAAKINRGFGDHFAFIDCPRTMKSLYDLDEHSNVYDDGILKYRETRKNIFESKTENNMNGGGYTNFTANQSTTVQCTYKYISTCSSASKFFAFNDEKFNTKYVWRKAA